MRATQPPTSRRQVTSLWFDLVGSTALIASLGDEAYADTLATVHERCAQILRRHGGQPDNPQGNDGLMAYFGHPVAIENAAPELRTSVQVTVSPMIDTG